MTTKPTRIEFDSDEIAAAQHWHDGQSSMLYAIASTGALSRGTIRPHTDGCDVCEANTYASRFDCPKCHGHGLPMTDDQWLAHLASKLEGEALASADDARLRSKRASRARRRTEAREMADYAVALECIATKCRKATAELAH